MDATGGGSPRSRHGHTRSRLAPPGPNGRSMLLSSEPPSNRQPSPLIPLGDLPVT